MKTEFFIKDIANNGRYYASFPDGFSLEIGEAVSFISEEEAERRIEEIIKSGQILTIVKCFVVNS